MIKPWYKQFWPWFLIALPLCVVIASFTTLAIFSNNAVSLVAEDYYKKGKAINIDLSRIKEAQALGLSATVASNQNTVLVQFDKGKLESYPALIITFTHRTLADQDFQKAVNPDASGVYRILLPQALSGPWFVEVEPHNKEWLLQGKVTFPSVSATPLTK